MYSILFLWFLIAILSITLFKLLGIKKNYLVCFCITFFIILFILNLESSIEASLQGCNLALKAIIPTIFPFTVVCNLLISYDGITLYSKILGPIFCKPLKLSKDSSFPLVASFLCGYPLGAKYASDIYDLGHINKLEYTRLLNIASNAGPIFLIGSVSAAMLSNIKYGYILLIANYLSIILVGLLTIKSSKITKTPPPRNTPSSNIIFGSALKNAIENGISTTLNICAFVIMFSVIINIIKSSTIISTAFQNLEIYLNLPSSILYNLFLGSIEFTNGCKLIASSSLSINLKLSLISFICSFSSLSVLAQVSSIVSTHNPSMLKYTFWKLIQGILSFVITYFSSSIFITSEQTSTFTFSQGNFSIVNEITLTISLILLIPLFLKILYIKFKKLHAT